MANPWERDWSQPQTPQGGVYVPPPRDRQRKQGAEATSEESGARVDVATERARIAKAQAEAAKAEAEVRKAETDIINAERAKEKADRELALPSAHELDLSGRRARMDAFSNQINNVTGLINDTTGQTSGWRGLLDYIPNQENLRLDAANAALGQMGLEAFRIPGSGPMTDKDMEVFLSANQPNRWSADSANIERIMNVRNRVDEQRKALGMEPMQWADFKLPQASLAARPVESETALKGKSEGGRVRDPAMAGFADQVRQAVANGATADQLIAMEAVKMAELGRPLKQERIQFYRDLEKSIRENPNVPLNSLSVNWGALEDTTEQAQDAGILQRAQEGLGTSDAGAGIIAAANAFGLGLPAAMSDDFGAITDKARQDSPLSSFAGDVIGSTGMTLAGIGAAPRLLGSAGGLGADTLYSTLRGGAEGGPVGAILGAGMGVTGNRLGAGFGGGANNITARVTGTPRPSAASRIITQNMDEARPDAIKAALESGRAIDMPVSVADVAGDLYGMAGAAYRRSNPNTQAEIAQLLIDRGRGQSGRLNSTIERELGPLGNPEAYQQQLIQQARDDSRPLYQAFAQEAPQASDEIAQILSTNAGQSAVRRAGNIAEMEGMPFDATALTPQQQNLVKMGFDDVLYNSRVPTSGVGRAELGAMEGMRQRYVSELDNLYPSTYPAARAAYAGPASIAEAVELGQGAMRELPRSLDAQIADLNPSQQDAFRFGARQSMADRANSFRDSTNPWEAIVGVPDMRGRMTSVFGEPQSQAMQDALAIERAMAGTQQNLIGGSQTATRLSADEALDNSVEQAFMNAAIDVGTGGAPVATGLGLANRFLKDRGAGLGLAGRREGVATEITDLLARTDTDPTAVRDLLAEAIAYRLAKEQAQRYAGAGTTGVLSGGVNTYGGIN